MGREPRNKVMGMFDTIKCDYPLPITLEMVDWDIDVQNLKFQTKDLENLLDDYIITPEGRLLHVQHERKWVDNDDSFFKGYLETINTKIVSVDYHGVIYFYCYEDLPQKDGKYYTFDAEYAAKFSDNKLTSIELFDYSIKDTTEYHLAFEKSDIERRQRANKWYNKYILYTKPVQFVRRKIYRFFYNLHQLTGKLHTFAIKHL